LRVPIDPQLFCYAVALPEADFAFFELQASSDIGSPKLFTHRVGGNASSNWKYRPTMTPNLSAHVKR